MTPSVRILTQEKLKLVSIMFLQVVLLSLLSPVFAQQAGIGSDPGEGAGSSSTTDFVDCIFKDGFEACLTFVEGYPDTDSDGFGDSASDPSSFCNKIWIGFADNNLDCDDSSDAIFPGNTESCDGLDNDCNPASADGSEDPGLNLACDGADTDLCMEGTQSCVGGVLVCSDTTDSTDDVCDGFDNDCDPSSADGSEDPGLGLACDTGQLGVCAIGTANCVGGQMACAADNTPGAEVCDGLDNDCDGSPDEGNPGGGVPCVTGQPGVCSDGVTECAGGGLICTAETQPGAEVCDGLDNDCDGTPDEGNPGGGAQCDTGLPGVCSIGATECVAGALSCAAETQPGAEVCDGLDNDCDGTPDEGNPGGGVQCDTGLPGVCSIGATECVAGSLSCVAETQPGAEVCDGLDNDCDGEVDEGCGALGESCSSGLHCGSGFCAENVCCDSTCDGFEQSCLEINTGAPDGMCMVVQID